MKKMLKKIVQPIIPKSFINFLHYSESLAAAQKYKHPSTKMIAIGAGSQTKSGTIAAVMLYNNKLECSSCHDVHNTFTVGTTGLLKVSQAGSQICLACHNK